MFNCIQRIAMTSTNLIAVQRAKRALRVRYGITLPKRTQPLDPVWLRAHD